MDSAGRNGKNEIATFTTGHDNIRQGLRRGAGKGRFSTQIHIRQFDVGQKGKTKPNACQKFVIFPTWKLQNVRAVFLLSSPACGKLSGKCGNPPQKQAPALDFCTFSTGFSTCGKNRPLLRAVYGAACGKLFALGKQTDNGPAFWQHYSTPGPGQRVKNPEKKKTHFSGNKRQLMLYFKMT